MRRLFLWLFAAVGVLVIAIIVVVSIAMMIVGV